MRGAACFICSYSSFGISNMQDDLGMLGRRRIAELSLVESNQDQIRHATAVETDHVDVETSFRATTS